MSGQAKHVAAVSLGVMGAGFLATLPIQGYAAGALLQGGFEAGLVGGLADWFAVTALFRHPMGIPIPHTALLPKNREKVIRSLISAIENDILTKDSIKQKISEIRIGERLVGLLEQRLPDVAKAAAFLVEQLLRHFPIDKAVPLIAHELKIKADSLDVAAIVQRLGDEAVARGYDHRAIDFLLDKVEEVARKPQFRDQLGSMALNALGNAQVGGFMSFALNAFAGMMNEEKLGGLLQGVILTNLMDMRLNHDHPLRVMVLYELRKLLVGLGDHEGLKQEVDSLKAQLLANWDLEAFLASWLESLRDKALIFIQDSRFTDEFVEPLAAKLIEKLKSTPEHVEAIEQWIQTQLVQFVEKNHAKIGTLVEENLNKFDNETLIRMLEEKVGKDLQWIRVNGAVCGFLIGIALTGFKMLF